MLRILVTWSCTIYIALDLWVSICMLSFSTLLVSAVVSHEREVRCVQPATHILHVAIHAFHYTSILSRLYIHGMTEIQDRLRNRSTEWRDDPVSKLLAS